MNVFITGGLTGLGFELTKLLLKDGHTVGVCSFEAKENIPDNIPPEVDYYTADVTDKVKMQQAIQAFAIKHGSLDVVYANAGINHPKEPVPDWSHSLKVVDVNINGVLNTFFPAIEIMKKQGRGHLVAASSVGGYAGLPGMSVYSGTKSFVKTFCESMTIDLEEFGITVSTICPAFIKTPLTSGNKHSMPFAMTQAQGGMEVYKTITNKMVHHIFPWQYKPFVFLLKHLPGPLYRLIMRYDLFGFKKGH